MTAIFSTEVSARNRNLGRRIGVDFGTDWRIAASGVGIAMPVYKSSTRLVRERLGLEFIEIIGELSAKKGTAFHKVRADLFTRR